MNEQDKEAFEKWWMSGFEGMSDMDVLKYKHVGKIHSEKAWQAALEYERNDSSIKIAQAQALAIQERERSKKLVEALDNLCDASIIYGEVNQYDEPNNILEMRLLAERALKEYRGEK